MAQQVAKVKMQIFPFGINKRSQGFTLLEVLLVLVIGGLLMGVAVSSLSEGPVLRKSSREVAASLRHARAQAVIRQQPTLWKMNIQERRFWIDGATADAGRQLSPSITAKINTTSAEVDAANQGGIRFFPDGSSTGGSVELTQNKQTFKVNVEWVTGRVSIQ